MPRCSGLCRAASELHAELHRRRRRISVRPDPSRKLLVGWAAAPDHFENWVSNRKAQEATIVQPRTVNGEAGMVAVANPGRDGPLPTSDNKTVQGQPVPGFLVEGVIENGSHGCLDEPQCPGDTSSMAQTSAATRRATCPFRPAARGGPVHGDLRQQRCVPENPAGSRRAACGRRADMGRSSESSRSGRSSGSPPDPLALFNPLASLNPLARLDPFNPGASIRRCTREMARWQTRQKPTRSRVNMMQSASGR